MLDLYLCPMCKMPFVAEDQWAVERRDGHCINCSNGKPFAAWKAAR